MNVDDDEPAVPSPMSKRMASLMNAQPQADAKALKRSYAELSNHNNSNNAFALAAAAAVPIPLASSVPVQAQPVLLAQNNVVPLQSPPKALESSAASFKSGAFSDEEDQKILAAVRVHGTNSWAAVLTHTGLNRSKKQVQTRYYRIKDTPAASLLSPGQPASVVTAAAAVASVAASSTLATAGAAVGAVDSAVVASTAAVAATSAPSNGSVAVASGHGATNPRVLELEQELVSCDAAWRARFAESLRRCAVAEQQLSRLALHQESARLGHVTYERQGASFAEMWQDGDAFLQLKVAQAELDKAKDKWETRKKAAKKALNADEVEQCNVRLAACKRDQQALTERLATLENEKQQHIRALRRLADEDASQFNTHPTMHHGRYLLLRLLGRGGFSEVYRAYDLQEHRDVAVKIHQLNSAWPRAKKESYTAHACREYNIQRQLKHERIVRLFDVFEIDANSFATVLEYCGGDDLDAQLRRHGTLPEREARLVVQQTLDGLRYLADRESPVIHYDLKPANILFDVDGNAKIADFGLSKVMDESERSIELTSQGAGTYWYLPPECFTEQGAKISLKVDVWSVGVVFFQMLFGQRPFGHGMSQQHILANNIIQRSQKVAFLPKPPVSQECKDFITLLLTHNPNERPSVHEAAAHQYLTKTPKET